MKRAPSIAVVACALLAPFAAAHADAALRGGGADAAAPGVTACGTLPVRACIVSAFPISPAGNGRTEVQVLHGNVTAQALLGCGGFDVLNDYDYRIVLRNHFSAAGRLERQAYEVRITDSVLYSSTNPERSVLGSPGEGYKLEVDLPGHTITITGASFKLILPGTGPVAMETGLWALDLFGGDVLASTGHDDVTDGRAAAVCALLAR